MGISVDQKASALAALMNILKCNIGTGVLSMPISFMHSGWVLGLSCLPIFGLLCTHAMFLLVNAQNHICQKLSLSELSYEETTEKSFAYGPEILRPFARRASKCVSMFLILTQFGISIAYVLFVAESVRKLTSDFLDDSGEIHIFYFIAALYPIMVLLNFVKTMKYLAVASTIANILQGVGLVVLLSNLAQDMPSIEDRKLVDFKHFPLYFGTAVFSFEGISIVLPVKDSMKKQKRFGGHCGVLTLAMTFVTILYMFLGTLGYLKYGDHVHSTITNDLPAKNFFYQADRLMFAVAIFLSYPLQMYVPLQILWPEFQKKLPVDLQNSNLVDGLFRAFLVLITFIAALAIPYLDLVISLVGALSSSFLALIFPPLVHMSAFWEDRDLMFSPSEWNWIVLKGIFLVAFGLIGSIIGTYTSVIALIGATTGKPMEAFFA